MKRIKFLIISLGIICLTALMVSCNSKELKNTEQTEETTAEIEAAMMQGRNTAKEFVNKQWNDSLELIDHLLKAKAVQSKYLLDNKPQSAEAFDSAFIQTVRTINPELAERISSGYEEVKRNTNEATKQK